MWSRELALVKRDGCVFKICHMDFQGLWVISISVSCLLLLFPVPYIPCPYPTRVCTGRLAEAYQGAELISPGGRQQPTLSREKLS